MISREQQRMRITWTILTERFGEEPEGWGKVKGIEKYLSALKKTPARIHTCGLGQALAFLKSRGQERSQEVQEHVAGATLEILGHPDEKDLIGCLRRSDV